MVVLARSEAPTSDVISSAECRQFAIEAGRLARQLYPAARKMPSMGWLARGKRSLNTVTYGDVVVVTRLDRLARSTRDFLNTLAELTERGVGFRSIKDTGIDTTSATGQLVLQILASIGEFERKLIRSRVEDGTKRARERGVKFGRKPKLNHFQRHQALLRLAHGETQADVARSYGVDRSTICRLENV